MRATSVAAATGIPSGHVETWRVRRRVALSVRTGTQGPLKAARELSDDPQCAMEPPARPPIDASPFPPLRRSKEPLAAPRELSQAILEVQRSRPLARPSTRRPLRSSSDRTGR